MSEERSSDEQSAERWRLREQELLGAIDEKNSRIIGLEKHVESLEEQLAAARIPRTRTLVLYRSKWFSALVTAAFIIFAAPLLLDYLGVVTLDRMHGFYVWLRSLLQPS